jgi:hypothetical protein
LDSEAFGVVTEQPVQAAKMQSSTVRGVGFIAY